jgi:hypothetical protein
VRSIGKVTVGAVAEPGGVVGRIPRRFLVIAALEAGELLLDPLAFTAQKLSGFRLFHAPIMP